MNTLIIAIVSILVVYIGIGYILVRCEKKIKEEKNKKKSKSLNKKVKKYCTFFCWGLLILLFILAFLNRILNPIWLVFALGTAFAFVGETSFILFYFENNNYDKLSKNKILLIYLFLSIVGLIIMTVSTIIYLIPQSKEIMMNFIILLLGFITMLVVGLGMLYFGIKGLKPPKGCTIEIYATCINLLHRYSNSTDIDGRFRSDIVYCPVYEYSYNGIKYMGNDDIYTYSGRCPNEGETVLIKINPDDPRLFWDGKRQIYTSILLIIAGVWTIILSSIGLTLVLR